MEGRKRNVKKYRQNTESHKMKPESHQKQAASKSKKNQQNQNNSIINCNPAAKNTYDPWGESRSIGSKSDGDGWGSNAQYWKKQNNSNQWQSRNTAAEDFVWDDGDSHFPRLGAEAPPPRVNVWEERKFKAEAIKALEPKNEYDEEAMLKQALELSLEAAKEEEKRRREEEAYRLQLEALKIEEEEKGYRNHMESPIIEDEQDNFSTSSPTFSDGSDLESPVIYQPNKVESSLDACSNHMNVSDFSKQEKGSNSGGARPKVNKVIDRFGVWGLPDKKAKIHSDVKSKPSKIVDFVDNILEDEKSSIECKPITDHIFEKKDGKMNLSLDCNKDMNPWSTSKSDDDIKTIPVSPSSNSNEILFDGKGTFTDLNIVNDLEHVDSSEKCEYPASCDSTVMRIKKLKNTEIDNSVETQAQVNRENEDHTTAFTNKESSVCHKIDIKEPNEFSSNSYNLFENTYKYVANDSVAKDSLQSREFKIPSTPSRDPWASSSLNTSVNIQPFSNKSSYESSEHELKHETESLQFNNFTGDKIHANKEFGSHTNNEPSAALLSHFNVSQPETLSNVPANDVESHILPPQPAPAPTLPQFPLLNNPMFASNPMFPGSMNFSPMYGYVMDSVMMQQMLLLSNPYFASQLLTMEQYYRSLGMHANVFSFQPQVIPNSATATSPPAAAGGFDIPSEQNKDPKVIETDMPTNVYNPDFQNPSVISDSHQSKSIPGNTNYEASFGTHIKPPGLDISIAQPDNLSTSRSEDDNDSWFKSYLCSEDTLPIPPPKPAALNVDECNSSVSVSKYPEPNQNFSSFHSMEPSVSKMNDVSHKTVSSTQDVKIGSLKSLTAVEACVTKTNVRGWSDSEDECTESIKPKNAAYSWRDDGWGSDNIPAKSIRNPTAYDEKKKTAYRQPASQPQVSRFQRNKMYK